MLDPNEMNRLIVKALHEPDEEEYTTNQKRVIYEIRECDYIPYLLNYKALILWEGSILLFFLCEEVINLIERWYYGEYNNPHGTNKNK